MKKEVFLKIIGAMIAVSALADTHFELLESIGFSILSINWIKLIGLIVALLLPSISSIKSLNKDGLGGSNPPPDKDEK